MGAGAGSSGSGRDPPFSLTAASKFDLTTYWGRVRHFQDVTDVRTLFASQQSLERSIQLLKRFEDGELPSGFDSSVLWQARKLRDATLHPDTGEPIFPLFRFAAFAPVNIPICAAMLYPTSNLPFIAFAQIANQSYNVAVNYANRNASSKMSLWDIGAAYSAAVATSCTIAVGLTKVATRLRLAGVLRAGVPYTAIVASGAVNVAFIRQKELSEGITVFDGEGTPRGKSVIAGQDAISKCILARALWTLPIIIFPPAVMGLFDRLVPRLRSAPRARYFLELCVITSCIWAAVPPAIAVYPQRDSLPASRLEPRFRNLRDSAGEPVTVLSFNKGL